MGMQPPESVVRLAEDVVLLSMKVEEFHNSTLSIHWLINESIDDVFVGSHLPGSWRVTEHRERHGWRF